MGSGFATDDSIVAIATPPGRGGIGVVRISGPRAHPIALQMLQRSDDLAPRHATFAKIAVGRAFTARQANHEGSPHDLADEVIVTYFRSPHSYTGDDVVEISAHGSPVVLGALVRAAMAAGARLAAPGEFTLRSFLNGKRDLVQAEAVADLIAAATPLQARIAFDQLEGTLTRRIAAIDSVLFDLIARLEASLDFPDEGYHFVTPALAAKGIDEVVGSLERLLADAARGRMIREGATIVIAGRPNVGKSSLFNQLAGADRAIVTAVAGTTRDLVTEATDIEGIAVTLVDTAGWRQTTDVVEEEGVARGEKARAVADLIVIVLDGCEPLAEEDHELLQATASQRRLIVTNKSDLVEARQKASTADVPGVAQQEDVVLGFSRASGRGSPKGEHYERTHVNVSATTGAGIDDLRRAIATALQAEETLRDTATISNARHISLLEAAHAHLVNARRAAAAGDTPEEFLLTDLQSARARLDEVVGVRTSDDVLRNIFDRFCIGK